MQKAYQNFFKGWNVKALGPRPTDEQLAVIHGLGARPGKQALANAMMLREGGASAGQIVMACGAPQLNKMRDLVARKLVTRDMNVTPTEAGHTVYKISLAAKGKAKIEQAVKAEAEGAKPDAVAKSKARNARKAAKRKVKEAAPEVTAQEPAVIVTEAAPETPAEQPQA